MVFITILTNTIHFLLLKFLCENVFTKNQKVYLRLIILLFIVMKSFSIVFQNQYMNLLFAMFTYFVFIFIYNFGNNRKLYILNIFWLIIFYSITLFSESLAVIIIKLFTGYTIQTMISVPAIFMFSNLLSLFCKFALVYTICTFYKLQSIIPSSKICILLLALPLSLLAIVLCIDPLIKSGEKSIGLSLSLVLFLISIVFTVCILNHILKQEKQQFKQELENTNIHIDQLYYAHINDKMEEVRSIKHDMLKQLRTIGTLLIEDKEQASTYLNELTGRLDNTIINYTENSILNSVLNSFIIKFESSNIKFHCRAVKDIDLHWISPVDITCIIGNILENAIYSCEHSLKQNIYFVLEQTVGYIILKIVNSCDSITYHKDSFKSIKRNGAPSHGIVNIKRCAMKYNANVRFKYNQDTKEFATTVIFPIKN